MIPTSCEQESMRIWDVQKGTLLPDVRVERVCSAMGSPRHLFLRVFDSKAGQHTTQNWDDSATNQYLENPLPSCGMEMGSSFAAPVKVRASGTPTSLYWSVGIRDQMVQYALTDP